MTSGEGYGRMEADRRPRVGRRSSDRGDRAEKQLKLAKAAARNQRNTPLALVHCRRFKRGQ